MKALQSADSGRRLRSGLLLVLVALAAAGCATVPAGPSRMALPGTGKSYEQFQADDGLCRQHALAQTGGLTADGAAIDSGVRSAALGTAVGALAGAALGGSRGAATGAGVGLLFGSAAGSGAAHVSANATQRQLDNTYIQCMYARGHKVPVSGNFAMAPSLQSSVAPPAPPGLSLPAGIPPPPPGMPPPPPPGVR